MVACRNHVQDSGFRHKWFTSGSYPVYLVEVNRFVPATKMRALEILYLLSIFLGIVYPRFTLLMRKYEPSWIQREDLPAPFPNTTWVEEPW